MLTVPRIAAMALVAAVFLATTAFAPKYGTKTITVINKTSFNVDRIYLSPVEAETWGNDILDEDEILKPGDLVEIEIECGSWDVKLVAGDESTCEISAVDVCSMDIWEIVAECGE